MKLFRYCGLSSPLWIRKMLFVESFVDSITHWAETFQSFFDETIEKLASSGKHIVVMGDFNIDLLKCASSSYTHNFLSSLQRCFLFPSIDKPTRVRSTFATLIDNIFINNPDHVAACGNIICDISDHFSQFCVLKSIRDKIKIKKSKV